MWKTGRDMRRIGQVWASAGQSTASVSPMCPRLEKTTRSIFAKPFSLLPISGKYQLRAALAQLLARISVTSVVGGKTEAQLVFFQLRDDFPNVPLPGVLHPAGGRRPGRIAFAVADQRGAVDIAHRMDAPLARKSSANSAPVETNNGHLGNHDFARQCCRLKPGVDSRLSSPKLTR